MASGLIPDNGGECTHYRRSEAIGSAGERLFSWSSVGTFTGWRQDIGSGIREQYQRRELTVTHKIFTASNPEIHEGDRIIDYTGASMMVRGVVDQAGLNRVMRLDCEEVLAQAGVSEASSSSSSSESSSS